MAETKTSFKEGRQKTGGRKKGTPNKVTAITKDVLAEIADGLRGQLADDLADLDPKDRVAAFIKLVEYVVPKPQRLDVEMNATVVQSSIEDALKELAAENEING